MNEEETTIKDIIRRVNAKVKLIHKHQKELQEIYDQCNHHGTVEEKSSYFSGSYNDHAYTRYWNQCTVCGMKSEDVIKEHGYYG
jgi:ribosomal protein S14